MAAALMAGALAGAAALSRPPEVRAAEAPLVLRVVSPVDGAFLDQPDVIVTVDAPAAVSRVAVLRARETVDLARRPGERAFFCGRVKLEPGPNLLRVLGYVDGAVATQRAVWVYLEPDRIRGVKVPEGFRRISFHGSPANEATCAPCHDMAYPPRGAPEPARPCLACHPGIAKGTFVHGPAGLGLCYVCHVAEAEPKYATPNPVCELCYRCHEHLREGMMKDPYQHGPTAAGRCTLCHSPHASPHIFQTRKHIFDLCTTCHAEKADGRHVVYAFSDTKATHPMKGRKEYIRKDRELVCSGCHNPHSATSPKLWRYDAARRDLLCQYCHRK